MSNKKANITIDNKKKVVRIDYAKATKEEKDKASFLGQSGYEVKFISEARQTKAIERANKETLTDESIKEALKDNAEALAKYEAIKTGKGKGKGFFAARKWYKTEILKETK